jgi:hypothetical protein
MVLTYKNRFNKKYGFKKDESHSIEEISKITNYKLSGLKKILERGRGAFYSDRKSVRPNVKSPTQWGMARIYASVSKGSKSSIIDKDYLKKK